MGSPSRWRSAASPPAWGRTSRSSDAGAATLFGEGPGAFVVSGPRDAFAAFGAAARVIGVAGGDVLRIAEVLNVPVVELSAVHGDGLAALLR